MNATSLADIMAAGDDLFARHQLAPQSPPDWQALAADTPEDTVPAEDAWEIEPPAEIINRLATEDPPDPADPPPDPYAAAQAADLAPVAEAIAGALREPDPHTRRKLLADLAAGLPAAAAETTALTAAIAEDMAAAFLAGAAANQKPARRAAGRALGLLAAGLLAIGIGAERAQAAGQISRGQGLDDRMTVAQVELEPFGQAPLVHHLPLAILVDGQQQVAAFGLGKVAPLIVPRVKIGGEQGILKGARVLPSGSGCVPVGDDPALVVEQGHRVVGVVGVEVEFHSFPGFAGSGPSLASDCMLPRPARRVTSNLPAPL